MLRKTISVSVVALLVTLVAGEGSVEAGHRRGRSHRCCEMNNVCQPACYHSAHNYHSGRYHYTSHNQHHDSCCDSTCRMSSCGQSSGSGCDQCNVSSCSNCCGTRYHHYSSVKVSEPSNSCCTVQAVPVFSATETTEAAAPADQISPSVSIAAVAVPEHHVLKNSVTTHVAAAN